MERYLTIVMPIFDDMTPLDFTGPYQFLVRTPRTRVFVASMGGASVDAEGLHFSGLEALEDIGTCDVLCVPGGKGVMSTLQNDAFLDQIQRLGRSARYITSVCTGSLILAAAGLITGRHAACHWASRDLLTTFGVIPTASRVVRDGNLLTGGGVTAGIDFALILIAELAGEDVARELQLRMEYAPEPPFEAGRPETAPPHVLRSVRASMSRMAPDRQKCVNAVAQRRGLNI